MTAEELDNVQGRAWDDVDVSWEDLTVTHGLPCVQSADRYITALKVTSCDDPRVVGWTPCEEAFNRSEVSSGSLSLRTGKCSECNSEKTFAHVAISHHKSDGKNTIPCNSHTSPVQHVLCFNVFSESRLSKSSHSCPHSADEVPVHWVKCRDSLAHCSALLVRVV